MAATAASMSAMAVSVSDMDASDFMIGVKLAILIAALCINVWALIYTIRNL